MLHLPFRTHRNLGDLVVRRLWRFPVSPLARVTASARACSTATSFGEQCLERVTDDNVVEFFHDRYDRRGREAPLMRESTLNKIGAFNPSPRLKLMPGQRSTHLDSGAIMDEGRLGGTPQAD